MTQDMEYLKTEPKDFVSGEDLLALKVFFDEIKFAHIGIGAMQKPRQIERLDAGGKKDEVTPETKRVCELLTGMPYEKLRIDG